MNLYRVGGAVRDSLLGYPYHETDWVVVGSTPESMRDAGYTQVGKDFPVFLHPETKEEYALARTERKSGHGYHGFAIDADPTVTLEKDLERRDLTINAMAMDIHGNIIDPFGGQRDLEARVFRHVSSKFVEDPLRVIRVARFAARYHQFGFSIAPETLMLMSEIVEAQELSRLSAERIWVETERALGESHPEVYFQTLKACGGLQRLLPALAVTEGIELLSRVRLHVERPDCRWAALISPLSPDRARETAASIKAPKRFIELSEHICRLRPKLKHMLRDAEEIFVLLKSLDAIRREEPFKSFCLTLAALEDATVEKHPTCLQLLEALSAVQSVNAASVSAATLTGPALGTAIDLARIEQIDLILKKNLICR